LWDYEGICFGHVMFKVCQYGTNDDQVSMGLTLVTLKKIQVSLHKTITWTKNQGKESRNRKMHALKSGELFLVCFMDNLFKNNVLPKGLGTIPFL
jgi:hypothetical protein